jgi:DNA mismatch repair protein MutH
MENWKKAVVAGTLAGGAVLALTGKRAVGLIMAGVGGALLAAEYPEKMEQLRENFPEYADRAMRVLENVSRAGERVSELLEKRGKYALEELRSF